MEPPALRRDHISKKSATDLMFRSPLIYNDITLHHTIRSIITNNEQGTRKDRTVYKTCGAEGIIVQSHSPQITESSQTTRSRQYQKSRSDEDQLHSCP